MAWTWHSQDDGSDYGDTVTITAIIAVTAGDLIVVGAGSQNVGVANITGIADDDENEYTLRDQVNSEGNAKLRTAYAIASENNETLTITATLSAGTGFRQILAVAFTPDGGDTVELDTAGSKGSGYEASPFESGTFWTEGDDEVCVAFIIAEDGSGSNHEIPSGTAADGTDTTAASMDMWYKILTSTLTDKIAEVDWSGSAKYACECLAFKSTAAAGGTSIVPRVMYYYRRLRT